MKLCEILVHLDQSPRAQARLDIAASLTRQHGAHLTALHVIDVAVPVMAMGDGGGGGANGGGGAGGVGGGYGGVTGWVEESAD